MKKILLFLVWAVFLAANASLSGAAEETTGDYFKGIGTKFVRGLVNTLVSPAEIPCTIRRDMADNPRAGFFTGFGKGAVLMLRRILNGVTEVGTFIIPMEATIPPVCSAG